MEKVENTECPNCGFNFKNIPPQSQLYNCDCGKSQADITKEYIRIISEEIKESDSRNYTCGYYGGEDITDYVFSPESVEKLNKIKSDPKGDGKS